MNYREKNIRVYYNEKQVLQKDSDRNFSKSPIKPKLLLEYINKIGLNEYFQMRSKIEPFTKSDFLIAHKEDYVNAMFNGIKPLCESSGLKWSEQFLESLTYTNASLFNAIKESLYLPEQVMFSPTSGFHHATPDRGCGFCSFSGQVIASMKIYEKYGLSGAYIDLDGHYGNSISDSYDFVPNLDKAIPYGCNINPIGEGKYYLKDLAYRLEILDKRILSEEITYVVFAHGADSHIDDDLGGQLSTEQWLQCSTMVFQWIKKLDRKLKRPVPLTIALFGGYRSDDFQSVLSLHTASLAICLNTLCGADIDYKPTIKQRV